MNFGIQTNFDDNTGFKPIEKKEEPNAPIVEAKQEAPLEKKDDTPIFKELKPEAKPEQPIEAKKPIETKQPEAQDINDEAILNYLNSKNQTTFTSLEEYTNSLVKEKEVEKVVNPWEDVMDADDEAYLKYKRETGRTRKEFDFLNQDFSSMSPLDLSIERIKQETGLKDLTKAQAKEYLEDKLGIDLDKDELDVKAKIELNTYAKPYRDTLEKEKETYKKPNEEALKNRKGQPQPDLVKLPDGSMVSKQQHETFLENRRIYQENLAKAVNSVAATDYLIEIDDNGEKRQINFKYDYSKDDKHSMLSDAKDLDATIAKRYQTKEGLNHSALAESMWWGERSNQQKIIAAVYQQARAEAFEEMISKDNNEHFSRKPIERMPTKKDGYGSLEEGITGAKQTGFGVKLNL